MELRLGFGVARPIREKLTQFVMGHFIVRAKCQSVAIKRDPFFSIGRRLRLFEVLAKGAVTITPFLRFDLLSRRQFVDLFPLARDLRFLLLELFCLLLKDFRVARGQKKSASKEKNRDETRRQPCSFHKPFLLRPALASSKAR